MKIVCIRGDMSNQLYQSALYLYLKNKYPNEKLYGCYTFNNFPFKVSDNFNVPILPRMPKIFDILAGVIFRLERLFHFKASWMSTDDNPNDDATFFLGYWQNKKYYTHESSWFSLKLPEDIGDDNRSVLKQMQETNSVAVHIRRGDYMKEPENYDNDPMSYYERAFKVIRNKVENPTFFFFSNDINWVRENLGDKDKDFYIDWNTGKRSILDLYLMSNAKNNIVTNSTFSYWAGYLNKVAKIKIYPKNWFNPKSGKKNPPMFFEDWIAL